MSDEERMLRLTRDDFDEWFYERMYPDKDHPQPKWDDLEPAPPKDWKPICFNQDVCWKMIECYRSQKGSE